MYAKNQFKTNIQYFQCDNRCEFINCSILTYLQSNDITIPFSCPYTSQQNGKTERSIRTINNIVRTFLFQASLTPTFWTDALLTVVHTLNLLPTTTLSFKTPFEAVFGFFPKYDLLRVLGCLCYLTHIPLLLKNFPLGLLLVFILALHLTTRVTSVLIFSHNYLVSCRFRWKSLSL